MRSYRRTAKADRSRSAINCHGDKNMPRGPKGEKRPADVIGNAVMVMRIATGEETAHRACNLGDRSIKNPRTAQNVHSGVSPDTALTPAVVENGWRGTRISPRVAPV